MPLALKILTGAREGEIFALPEGEAITIGRDAANSIRVNDRKLSRIHCQFELINGRCQVTDLNSTNGTMVNNIPVEGDTCLFIDDEVEAGMTCIRLIEVSADDAFTEYDNRMPQSEEEEQEDGFICEECGGTVTEQELIEGNARHVGGRYYCAKCTVSFDALVVEEPPTVEAPAPATAPPPTQEVDDEEEASEIYRTIPADTEIAGVRIISPIAEGRLGWLYKGEQVSMGRMVTLKMLSVTDGDWAHKYLNAVYASGQLVHQNIALIFDTGEEDGAYYLVREYVEGQSVQEKLADNQPLPLTETYNIMTQLAYAIEHAAERQVFHGGLCPMKVLVGEADVVKVTGFGLPQNPPHGMTDDAYHRHALPYAAPERLQRHSPLNFAGDVYSLVAIFYHMLTGRPPFSGSTSEKIAKRIHQRQPAPLNHYLEHVPEAAQQIVNRGLSKDLSARYQSPRELLFDIEEKLRREI